MKMLFRLAIIGAVALSLSQTATSQAEPPKHEFRGAWIATVANLDWPSCRTCEPSQQQDELVQILDRLKAAGINAALFQVRTESDAFYDSPYEPWSYWLTNEQGADPGWDPLAFAVEEAHKRGMELHAWFNPYRADRGSNYTKAANHVTVEHPEWILDYETIKILDPGLPEVRDHVTNVIMDVVRRYDIDGVHFDDYFYPYEGTSNQDQATYAEYGGGFNDIGNWRRFNVFRFVRQVGDSLRAERPEVKYGISPFGIWKNGVPTGIVGMDAYNQIYADAVGWLDNQLLDYITPQLYWAFGGGQDYALLAPWWESQRNERHYYPGLGLYKADRSTFANNLYSASEVPNQIRFNRSTPGIQGNILFRAKNITQYSTQGFSDTLKTDLYRYPALTPIMEWKSQDAPGAPIDLAAAFPTDQEAGLVGLSWSAPAEGDTETQFFAVYRIPQAEATDLGTAMQKAENLAGITGETRFDDSPPRSDLYTYVVTSVSDNSIESAPSNAVQAQGGTSTESNGAFAFTLDAARPNPVTSQTELAFTLRQPANVTLRVVDVLGREVARLIEGAPHAAARHTVAWTPGAGLSSGTYFVVLEADGDRATRPVLVVR